MQYKVDLGKNQSPHINYEPSTINGLKEAKQDGKEYTPHVEGNLVRESIDRQNNFKQAGGHLQAFRRLGKGELITNLVNTLAPCDQRIQTKMIDMLKQCDKEHGSRVEEGLKNASSQNTSSREPIEEKAPKMPRDRRRKRALSKTRIKEETAMNLLWDDAVSLTEDLRRLNDI